MPGRIFLMICIMLVGSVLYAQQTSTDTSWKLKYTQRGISVPSYPDSLTVAQDGSGDYQTIQEAINAVRDLSQKQVVIHIKPGVYREKIIIPSWKKNIFLKGESNTNTIITNDDYSGKENPGGRDQFGRTKFSTYTSFTVLVQGAGFRAEDLTIENKAGRVGQAVALHVEADRVIIVRCRLLGNQDTLYTATSESRQYYQDCYIEGTTDFIFGEATCVFSDCRIRSLSNSYITAAATSPAQSFGYVFMNCILEADSAATKCFLGRPWRPYAKTVFLNCVLGKHIVSEGWNNWNNTENEKTVIYAEYQSSGAGAQSSRRVSWSKQLTQWEADKYTYERIFRGWIPEAGVSAKKRGDSIPVDTTYSVSGVYRQIHADYPGAVPVIDTMPASIRAERDIVYANAENSTSGKRDLHLDIFRPNDNKTRAAVILIHGGGWRSGTRSMQVPIAQRLAVKGFVTIPVEYQLSLEARYPAAVYNIKAAIRYIKANAKKYGIDTNRIAVSGCSAGGQLAALVGLTNGVALFEGNQGVTGVSSNVQAIIDIDGVVDFLAPASLNLQRKPDAADVFWFGGSFEEMPEIWKQASPIFWARQKTAVPILFLNSGFPRFHAGQDELIGMMKEWGIYTELHKFDVKVHPFWLFHPWADHTIKHMTSFLQKVLK